MGVHINETCYKTGRVSTRDFTVDAFWEKRQFKVYKVTEKARNKKIHLNFMSQKSESNQILWPLFKVHLKPLIFEILRQKKIRVTLNQLLKVLKPFFVCLLLVANFKFWQLLSSTGIIVYISGHCIWTFICINSIPL